MRTTLAIDDDVLSAAKELAASERKTLGEIISLLARRALRPAAQNGGLRNGVPLLTTQPHTPRVTSEMVKQLAEELP